MKRKKQEHTGQKHGQREREERTKARALRVFRSMSLQPCPAAASADVCVSLHALQPLQSSSHIRCLSSKGKKRKEGEGKQAIHPVDKETCSNTCGGAGRVVNERERVRSVSRWIALCMCNRSGFLHHKCCPSSSFLLDTSRARKRRGGGGATSMIDGVRGCMELDGHH